MIRLQKHIADLGICSRRKAEVLIAEGKVKVNGEFVTEMGVKIDPEKDDVEVVGLYSEGKTFQQVKSKKVYIVLNKPVSYICSASDSQGRTIMSLLTPNDMMGRGPDLNARVYPVGRLDKDSEGLVLLTNDGELTNQLTHPRYEHKKEYEVVVDKILTPDARKVLESGMSIGKEFAEGIEILKVFNKGKQTVITVALKEGKNRQIRKMFGRLGFNVSTLRRTKINKLSLGVLPIGKWRYVAKDKII